MKYKDFKGSTHIQKWDAPDIPEMPIAVDESELGLIIFCQSLNFWERIRVLFGCKIWASQVTQGKDIMPTYYTTSKKKVLLNK